MAEWLEQAHFWALSKMDGRMGGRYFSRSSLAETGDCSSYLPALFLIHHEVVTRKVPPGCSFPSAAD